jgi:hypothetical protein
MANSMLTEATKLLLENGWNQKSLVTGDRNPEFQGSPIPLDIEREFTATFFSQNTEISVHFPVSTGHGFIEVRGREWMDIYVTLDRGFPRRVIPTLSLVLEMTRVSRKQ